MRGFNVAAGSEEFFAGAKDGRFADWLVKATTGGMQNALDYVTAALVTCLAVALRVWVGRGPGEPPLLILFLIPVMVSAYCGGLGPGLLSVLLAALGTDLFVLQPHYSLSIANSADVIGWSALIVVGTLIAVMTEALHRARKFEHSLTAELERLNAELEARVKARTAELEAANKELEAFSYSISHDLRAPLRGIDGFSNALIEDYGPDLSEQARSYLSRIQAAARRMGALIDDLLTFSRLSRKPLRKRSVNTERLVRDLLDDMSVERAGRHIDIRVGIFPLCEADPALLKQVWINLLSNAVKYTRQQDHAIIEIDCDAAQNPVVYFVRDNGAGFDMKYVDKLFGVFQRLHLAEEFDGTGVGLAIVRRIVDRHGGRIWVNAEVNRGATFYFTLEGGNPE